MFKIGLKGPVPLTVAWLGLGISSLVIAGLFAMLIALARTPTVALLAGHLNYQRALAGHVTFALLIFFLTFIGAFYVRTSTLCKYPQLPALGHLSFFISLVGTVLLILPLALPLGRPLMHDYVPVITHPLFALGLMALALGFLLATINYLQGWWRGHSQIEPPEARGLAVSGFSYTLALIVQVITLFKLEGGPGQALLLPESFWGTGHILQFVYTSAMIAVMYLILRWNLGVYHVTTAAVRWTFSFYGLAALSFLLYYTINNPSTLVSQRDFFGLGLMGLGLGLPSLLHLVFLAKAAIGRLSKLKAFPWKNEALSSLALSLGLFLTGGAIALLGLGPDTRVPAHYHAMVGAVTLSFMGIVPSLLREINYRPLSIRLTRCQPYLYGLGVLAVSLAMAWAGALGAPRKVPGFSWAEAPALLALNTMGLGALLAMAGGIIFVINNGLPLCRSKR